MGNECDEIARLELLTCVSVRLKDEFFYADIIRNITSFETWNRGVNLVFAVAVGSRIDAPKWQNDCGGGGGGGEQFLF